MRSLTLRVPRPVAVTLLSALLVGAALAAEATPPAAGSAAKADEFTGNLVNMAAGVRRNQPFTLSIDHYATPAEVQALADTLAGKGPYSLRDQLWKSTAGYLSVGGRLGYPVAAVLSEETAGGRRIQVVVNRPLSTFEVQYYTRSSHYPFSVIELSLDKDGHGDGHLIGAAKIQVHGSEISFESLGVQPLRLLDVRED